MVDSFGVIYVADTGSHTIRKISRDGAVSTIAGTAGLSGAADGVGAAARFNSPNGLALDTAGNVYIADSGNSSVRKITPAGLVSTIFNANPDVLSGIAVDNSSNIFFWASNKLYEIPAIGRVRQIALGASYSVGANGSTDFIFPPIVVNPSGLASDSVGNIYWLNSGSDRTSGLNIAYPYFPVSITANTGVTDITLEAGATAQLSVTATGSSLKYAWFSKEYRTSTSYGENIGISTEPTASISAMLGRGFSQYYYSTNAGAFGVTVWNVGSFATITANLTTKIAPPTILRPPTPIASVAGQSAIFTVSYISTNAPLMGLRSSFSFVWKFNGTPIQDAPDSDRFIISNVKASDAGSYSVTVTENSIVYGSNSITSAAAALTVTSAAVPQISMQPQSLALKIGTAATFSLTASGTPVPTYQWKKDGAPIIGATSSTYAISAVATSDSGEYAVVVSNSAGSAISTIATLTVTPTVIAPAITTQPTSFAVLSGAPASISVIASGTSPMSYQWTLNGVILSGATSATYAIPAAASRDAGSYTCVVSNSAGSATSAAGVLTVNVAPAITNQPVGQTVLTGSPVTLSVSATGNPSVTYQWILDGALISGANSATYTLSPATTRDSGSYACVISNSAGSVISTEAILTVNVPPSITTQPTAQTVIAGSAVTLSVMAIGSPSVTYQWRKDGTNLNGATSSTLFLSGVTAANAGSYTCVITNTVGSVMSDSVTLTVNPSSALANLSVRTTMSTGQTLIVGAVVRGGSKNVLIRAGGPALNQFGLPGMVDPNLEIYTNGNALVAANNDWPATLKPTFTSVGAFPFIDGSKDSALIQAFEGSFTALARGTGPGALLIEAYDVTGGTAARLINVSARNKVGTGGDVLIAGFVITGTGTKQLLIRGVGPGLGQFGVTGFLVDPKIQIFDSKNVEIAANDNWTPNLGTTFTSVGAFNLPANSKDAALLVTLEAGASYTVIVSGADGGIGDGIVEIYEIVP